VKCPTLWLSPPPPPSSLGGGGRARARVPRQVTRTHQTRLGTGCAAESVPSAQKMNEGRSARAALPPQERAINSLVRSWTSRTVKDRTTRQDDSEASLRRRITSTMAAHSVAEPRAIATASAPSSPSPRRTCRSFGERPRAPCHHQALAASGAANADRSRPAPGPPASAAVCDRRERPRRPRHRGRRDCRYRAAKRLKERPPRQHACHRRGAPAVRPGPAAASKARATARTKSQAVLSINWRYLRGALDDDGAREGAPS
jgi:hypothetical protein